MGNDIMAFLNNWNIIVRYLDCYVTLLPLHPESSLYVLVNGC